MNKTAIIILFIMISVLAVKAQFKDSLYTARACIIILNNGFEAQGIITRVEKDTIWFRDEFGEYRVPKKHIIFVKDINEEDEEITETEKTEFVPRRTEECNVYLEAGSMLKGIRLYAFDDSTLIITKGEMQKNLPISRIRKIVFTGSGFGKGALIGAGVGLASGLLFGLTWAARSGSDSPNFGEVLTFSLVCSIPGGLIGGVIGAISKTDKSYLFPPGYSITKSKRIKYIIEKHNE